MTKLFLLGLTTTGLLAAFAAAGCSSASGGNTNGGAGGGGNAGGVGAGTGTGGLNFGGSGNSAGSGNSGGGYSCTPGHPDPTAIDVPGNGKDDDCDGQIDNAPTGCDAQITGVADNDPMNAARAIGLCQISDGNSWGVVDAKYVMADGTPLGSTIGHGLVDNWGPNVNVQEGTHMLVMSSGTARRPSDLGFQSPEGADHGESSACPPGFPIDSPACPGVSAGASMANDPVGLELKIKAPINAKSIKFNFDFYTYEFPIYVCTTFNDFFVALQDPAPSNASQGNISFDSQHNPVSVNNGYLEVCDPNIGQTYPFNGGKKFDCKLGPGPLSQTGFDELGENGPHAATGWLETASPVQGGQIFTIRFAIWDAGDHILDSTVLVDNFTFTADETTGSVTNPVPTPK